MTLDEAVKTFEARFSRIEEIVVYADDLIELVSGGIKEEGGWSPVWCIDEATAARLWLEAAEKVRKDRGGGVLVWRTKPECSGYVFYHHSYASSPDGGLEPVTLYRTYSRFAVRAAAPDYLAAAREIAEVAQ